jgi:hypothetical protein
VNRQFRRSVLKTFEPALPRALAADRSGAAAHPEQEWAQQPFKVGQVGVSPADWIGPGGYVLVVAARYGRRPRQHLADGGFAKRDDIEALARAGVEAYVPVPLPRDPTRDRHAARPDDPPGVAAWRVRLGGAAAPRPRATAA